MELSADQRLYLQTIFDYFHEHGKWPTYRYLDRELTQIRRDLDIEKIAKSLPAGFASTSYFNLRPEDEAILSISAIYLCAGSEEELADFVKVLHFCVEKYFSAQEDTVQISSDELSQQLGMSELSVRKVGLLIQNNGYLFYTSFGFNDNDGKSWVLTLSRRIRELDGVKSIEQYFEKLDQIKKELATPVPILSQPVKNEPAIDVPALDMSQIGTQYHIVQGDQYNISGNAGDVKVKSPSIDVAASKKDHRSPWMSGSFYFVVFIVIIAALSVAGRLLPLYALPIVLMGGILALSTIGAFQLRQDERLSEENFLKLMALSFKYLPWLKRKDAKSNESGNQLY